MQQLKCDGRRRRRSQLLATAAVAATLSMTTACAPAAVLTGTTAAGVGMIHHAMTSDHDDDCHGTPACGLGALDGMGWFLAGSLTVLASLTGFVALAIVAL